MSSAGARPRFKEPCHVTRRFQGECIQCGTWPDELHILMRAHGWFCRDCCPVCGPAKREGQRSEPRLRGPLRPPLAKPNGADQTAHRSPHA